MRETEPSKTALAAAAYWAIHQLLDGGRIFTDPLASWAPTPDGRPGRHFRPSAPPDPARTRGGHVLFAATP
ncbi:hypothetical protein [Phenylobacterium sp.]|jgi:hypothetical protein|uniref:hypothetical protein n=1 Tax=Phenylobacterium sp. TaxID=1871053 RepID=UPI002E2F5CC5|nr:hypothetical protein [Phenylobacterium sp.]HEX4713258.1 hypothetical protein [Phenylobacterium sp.]